MIAHKGFHSYTVSTLDASIPHRLYPQKHKLNDNKHCVKTYYYTVEVVILLLLRTRTVNCQLRARSMSRWMALLGFEAGIRGLRG